MLSTLVPVGNIEIDPIQHMKGNIVASSPDESRGCWLHGRANHSSNLEVFQRRCNRRWVGTPGNGLKTSQL